jgi:hypothetical protein
LNIPSLNPEDLKLSEMEKMDLFDNPAGSRTSLPKNTDFSKKSTFFTVFNLRKTNAFRLILLKRKIFSMFHIKAL